MNKLIPKQQYGGTSPTMFLYDQAKKTMSDEYKASKQAYDLYLQQGYKNPMSFEDFIKSQDKYIGEIKEDTKNKKNLVDKVLHAGEYGDSGNGPSIHNIVTMGDNPLVDLAGYFAPYLGPAKAFANLTSSEGIPKTVNHLKNSEYSDAALSGVGDALDVAFVGSAKPLIKKTLTEVVKQYPETAGKISKPLATKLILDDAIETGTTQLANGTILFTNPTMEGGNVLRRVTSPQEAEYTSRMNTWVDPQVLRNTGLKIFDREKRNWKEDALKNPQSLSLARKAPGHNHGVYGTHTKATFYPVEKIAPNKGVLELPITEDNLIRTGYHGKYSDLKPYSEADYGASAYRWIDFYNPQVSKTVDGGLYYMKNPSGLGWQVFPLVDGSNHYININGLTDRQKYLKEFGKQHLINNK